MAIPPVSLPAASFIVPTLAAAIENAIAGSADGLRARLEAAVAANIATPGQGGGAPVLIDLTFSTTFQVGRAVAGTITGAASGSTITCNIPGITVNSAARSYAGTPTGSAGTVTNAFVETPTVGSPNSTAVTIAAAPFVTLSSAIVQNEGNSGTTTFAYTLTLNRGGNTAAMGYTYSVAGNGANPADAADFGGTFPSGSGTFAVGEVTKTIMVLVTGDTAFEPTESFTLSATLTGYNTVTATGTITNDDSSGPAARSGVYASTTRLASPSANNIVTTSTSNFRRCKLFFGHGVRVGKGYRFIFPNFTIPNGLVIQNPNAMTIEGAVAWINGTAVPLTFGGASSITMSATTLFAVADALTVDVGANASGFVETVYSCAVGDKMPYMQGIDSVMGTIAGEGYEQAGTSRLSNLGTALSGGSPSGGAYGPWFGACNGALTTDEVPLLLADSIGEGANAPNFTTDARGNRGYITKGMDTVTNGRRSFLNAQRSGQSLTYLQPSNGETVLTVLKKIADVLGNVPFTYIHCQDAHNDMSLGSLASFQNVFNSCRNYCKTNFPSAPWVQTSIPVRTNSSDLWTSESGQTTYSSPWDVGGLKFQAEDWFASEAAKTAGTGQVDKYLDEVAPTLDSTRTKFKDLNRQWTLRDALVADTSSSIALIGPQPTVGEVFGFEPTDGTNQDGNKDYAARTVTLNGDGSWQVVLNNGVNSAKKVLKAHAAGSIARSSASNDTEHWNTPLHDAAALRVDSLKGATGI